MADLIELEYALDYGDMPRDAKDKQGILALLISACSQEFRGLCGGVVFLAASYTEDARGGRERLKLKHRPVTALTSITDRMNIPLVVKPAAEYRTDLSAGLVYRTDDTTGIDTKAHWLAGRNRWRVVYDAGYALAAIPEDVKIAVAELVNARWEVKNGLEIEERRGDWTSKRTDGIPKRVLEIAARYREEAF